MVVQMSKRIVFIAPLLALFTAGVLATTAGCGAFGLVEDSAALLGDVDADGAVTQADLDLLTAAFGLEEGDPGFLSEADLTGDGIIGLDDIQALTRILDAAGS